MNFITAPMILIIYSFIRVCTGNNCKIINFKADCTNLGLRSVPQDLKGTILILDLTENKLTKLENKTFERYVYLITLILDNNKLEYLEEDAFIGLTQLQTLSMQRNTLDLKHAYPIKVFSHLPKLVTLLIPNNVERSPLVPIVYPYFGFLLELTDLIIDLVQIPVFSSSGLVYCKNLTYLRFSNCDLLNMHNNTFIGMPSSVKSIHFKGCNNVKDVQANFLKPFPNLLELNINHTSIHLSRAMKVLYPFENKSMEAIIFHRVNCENQDSEKYPMAVKVTKEMMKHLQRICVRTLVISQNGIVDFESGSLLTYNYPECFQTIVLTGNRFLITSGDKLIELITFKFKLVNLITFDFSYNPVQYVNIAYLQLHIKWYTQSNKTCHGEPVWKDLQISRRNKMCLTLSLPPQLEVLRLSHQLTLAGGDTCINLQNASKLRYLDVSYFQLTDIPEIRIEGPNKLEYIDISGIDSTLYSGKSFIPLLDKVSTVIMQNSRLSQIMPKNNSIFKLVPNVKCLDISQNAMWFLKTDAFVNNTELETLNLNYNLFKEIPIAVTSLSNLKFLDVRYNLLQTINETLRNWMDEQNNKHKQFTLFLHGNVFKCTCETVDFVAWIFQTKIQFDKKSKKFLCRLDNGTESYMNQVYGQFHELFSDCNSGMWVKIGTALLVGFGVITIFSAIIFNFRWQIAYFMYKKFKRVIENDIKKKFKYDVYLSYADDSVGWISNTLVPKIERSWNMRMCIGDRDILAGEMRSDAIANAVSESRHVFFIISQGFKENIWTSFEIDRTKYEKHANKLQKIVIITRSVSMESIPVELDGIWEDAYVINWLEGDSENGWDKLRLFLFSESF